MQTCLPYLQLMQWVERNALLPSALPVAASLTEEELLHRWKGCVGEGCMGPS